MTNDTRLLHTRLLQTDYANCCDVELLETALENLPPGPVWEYERTEIQKRLDEINRSCSCVG